jgi:pantetheine-phosphate adenylyltransferase
MAEREALYPGTFDPVTLGHQDILARALVLFDRVTVAVAAGSKATLFTLAERVDLCRQAWSDLDRIEVISFQGLLVDELKRRKIGTVVRGIRNVGDYEHEWSMFGVNRVLLPGSEYVFLLARPELATLSSSLVKEVARHGGDVTRFVPPPVAAALADRLAGDQS